MVEAVDVVGAEDIIQASRDGGQVDHAARTAAIVTEEQVCVFANYRI